MTPQAELRALLRHRRQLSRRPYLDVHLADHCNLNCAGCLHYSPVAEHRLLDLDSYESDLKRLLEVPGIDDGFFEEVLLMGGEPLLHPEVARAITITSSYFKNTPVGLSTNGLLLSRMGEDFWKACRDAKLTIGISPYPIALGYEALAQLVRDNGVEARLLGDVTGNDKGKQVSWRLALDETGSQNPTRSFALCQLDFTMQLRDGRIYPCNCGCYRAALNRHFGTDFRHEAGDYLEIGDLTGTDQLYELRSKPLPMCRYCNWEQARVVPWSRSHKAREEWIAPRDASGASE